MAYLKHNTRYSAILDEIDENNIHRASLENTLKKDIISDYAKFFKFASVQLKEFINVYYKKLK